MKKRLIWAVCGTLALSMSLACVTVASDKNRSAARIKYDLSIASINQGDTREALRNLLAALELDPGLPEAHNALGLVYHRIGHLEDAQQHYSEAVRLNPKFSEAFNNLGTLYIDLHRYDDAIAAFQVALDDLLYTTPYLAEGNMGWAYYQKGDMDQALSHIGNAVATNPQFCRGYEWLARIGVEHDRPADVVANSKRFQKYCANDASVATAVAPEYLREMQYYLGIGHLKQGHREAARAALTQCAVGGPEAQGFAGKCAQSLRTLTP